MMNAPTVALVEKLAAGLESASEHIVELACTCTPETRIHHTNGHVRACMGIAYASEYLRLARNARRALRRNVRK